MKISTWIVVGFWLTSAFLNTGLTASFKIIYIGLPLWVIFCGLWMAGAVLMLSLVSFSPDKFKVISLMMLTTFLIIGVVALPESPVHPFKQWYFSLFAVALTIFICEKRSCGVRCLNALGLIYLVYLFSVVVVNLFKVEGGFAGANQHQYYLSGLLGFVISLFALQYDAHNMPLTLGRKIILLALINVVAIFFVTKSRQMLPYGASLLLLSMAIYTGKNRRVRYKLYNIWVASAIIIVALVAQVLHLSGAVGNLFNIGAGVFDKGSRTIEIGGGMQERERAAAVWAAYDLSNASIVQIGTPELPEVYQVDAAGKELTVAAVTSSHNLWLDSIGRFGWLYALLLLLSVLLMFVCALKNSRARSVFYYYSITLLFSAWIFASHFDDEHFIYHIPFITYPLLILAFPRKARLRKSNEVDYIQCVGNGL